MKIKIYKKYIILIMLLIATSTLINFSIKTTYAEENSLDTKIYTRKQLQEMVVSTALSLYYNNYFSDYGQRAMDSLSTPGNYFNSGNLLWRDLNVTPESVGYSKYYHIDCSGYNFLIYKNTIGYDMAEYNVVNRYLLFDKDRASPVHRVSFYSGTKRLNMFREAYLKFGYGWNSGFLGNVARKAADNCGNDNCTKLKDSTNTTPYIYNNINGKDKNEVVYYFEARSFVSLDDVKEKYAIAEDALEPGDIIAYTKYDASENDTSGHVMFYAGDDIMTSSKNESGFVDLLLHSTGNGGGDYTSDVTSVNNKLYKKFSIVNSSAKDYIDGTDGRFESVYKNKNDYILRFIIIRPLNTVCESDSECKISNNTYNVPLTDTQLNNNEARVALKKTQVQQYMFVEKEYSTQKIVTSSEKDGYTRNIISEYNSVNVGDEVTFRLRLRNKFDQTEVSGIKLEVTIPDNATYVSKSCTDSCTKSGNKLIWENISISGENEKNDISFSIVPKEEGTISFAGYKVIKDGKTLQMDERTINVKPTQNGINKDILKDTVSRFQTLVDKGQITYVANGSHTQNLTDISTLEKNSSKTISTSGFGYAKLVYYNAFGLDLDELTGSENILNATKIKNAIFDLVEYPERNNLSSKDEDGNYPLIPEEEKTPIVFAKKTSDDVDELTGIHKIIAEMLVPGLYGGRHLKGNDNLDRVKFLRSFYNNSAYQSDLEVGDIIVSYDDDASTSKIFLYLGDDGENGPILTRFTKSITTSEPLFLYHTDKYLDTYYDDAELRKKTINKPSNQILNELFDKDLFVVLRPSRLATTVEYEYNGGIIGTKSYVAYTKYQNLVTPTKTNKTLKLINEKGNSSTSSVTHQGTSTFNCWTSDKTLTKCITNNSNLAQTNRHTIYAKWDETTITLPKYTATGYNHTGWCSDEACTKVVAQPNTTYTISKDETLYAKWEIKEYKVTFNSNGGSGTMSEQIFTHGTSQKLSKNTFTRNGYNFIEWTTNADGTGTAYSNQQEINITKNMTLYAKWKAKEYTVTFNANGGSGTMSKQVFTHGISQKLSKNTFTRNGYDFIGWTTNADGTGTSYTNEQSISITGNKILYAKWKAKEYTVTFNANGGSGSMSNQVFTYGISQKLSKNTFTRNGYDFVGWTTNADGTGTSYTNEQSISITGNKTLYAKWKVKEFTVTFNANGGSGSMERQTFEYGKAQKLNTNSYTKTGYNFTGWTTNADGTGTKYNNKQEISITSNITLYANWEENTSYVINNYPFDDDKKIIDQIDINTNLDDYKKNIELNSDYTIDIDYKEIGSNKLLYTGSKTRIYKNNVLVIEYTNIIRGEVNGDGKINYLDYVNVYNHIQKVKHPESTKKELVNEFLISADISNDNKVNYLDYVQIYNKIKELKGDK